MSESNTYFAPVEFSMLSEYLSSGFIGLTASRQPDSDIQSLGFPNVSIVEHFDDVVHNVCLEIKLPQTATKSSKNKYNYLKGPVSIARIQNIIFFDKQDKENFKYSFSMFKDIPFNLFNQTIAKKSKFNKPKELLLATSKSTNNIYNYINEITTLNIGVVESYCHLSEEFDFQINIKFPKTKINPKDIYEKIIIVILKEAKLFKDIPQDSFDLLKLYLNSVEIVHTNPEKSSVTSEDVLYWMKDQINPLDETDAVNVYINKFIDKTKLIMIGMTKSGLLDDQPNLILQRAIFLAITRKNFNSIDNTDRNLSLGLVVGALAKLLIIYRSKLSDLPQELWRNNREQLDNYLIAAEQIAQLNKYELNANKVTRANQFNAKVNVSINNTITHSKTSELKGEIEEIIAKLRSLKFNPKPGADGSIKIEVEKENELLIPIELIPKECPITNLKRNVVISSKIIGLNKLLDKKKTRNEVLTLLHYYMVSVGIINKDTIEISRYQLVDTMDRAELAHHIDLIIAARIKLAKVKSVS